MGGGVQGPSARDHDADPRTGELGVGRAARPPRRANLKAFLPPPVPDVLIFVCGPPAMYESLCGPRDDPELTGVLRDLGYSKDQGPGAD